MKKRILVVEDDFEMRKLEKELLETAGYEILEAGNAKDGIAVAVKERPDLILMDIRLPSKKRGIGAARILRKDERTRGIPIIFVTGYTEGEDTEEVKNIANCEYVTKPFRMRALLKAVKRHVK
jgi:two-component system cell cycle response regulator DivK